MYETYLQTYMFQNWNFLQNKMGSREVGGDIGKIRLAMN